MASSEKHQLQYESNRDFINDLLNQQTPKNDWIITAAFYSALHLVDKAITEAVGEKLKPTSHIKRNEQVGKIQNFKKIRRQYQALYMDSRSSRYECVQITESRRNDSITYLEHIEKELNKKSK